MEISSQGPEIFGGMGTEWLASRLEPGQTMRLTRSDSDGCPGCAPAHIPTVMSEGLTKFLTIHGLEDGRAPVRVQIGIRLNSSFGRRSDGKRES